MLIFDLVSLLDGNVDFQLQNSFVHCFLKSASVQTLNFNCSFSLMMNFELIILYAYALMSVYFCFLEHFNEKARQK